VECLISFTNFDPYALPSTNSRVASNRIENNNPAGLPPGVRMTFDLLLISATAAIVIAANGRIALPTKPLSCRAVLDCASPLARFDIHRASESGRGLPHSRTLARGSWSMVLSRNAAALD
jgi:hypothetical protein